MNGSPPRDLDIFNEARILPAGKERDNFLAASCGHDEVLRDEVLLLLEADESAGNFLIRGLVDHPAAVITEKAGDRIGRYKLLEQIGEGGCGVVYLAEQEQPVRRQVALKVIKLGMDTRQVIARFEAERQALAMMDHPNIARVFDAGATETGRPFFVMELVPGAKITDYCDAHQLRAEERLALFTQVCHAIQHAHQKGIIHRDIKPSNILVTVSDGVAAPKVIDFGIAKATEGRLSDLTVFTELHHFIGTPAYMSPEQAEMTALNIDTRTDIYSLGVLLYELLTGKTPFDAKRLLVAGVDEIRRIIRESQPPAPSTRLSTMTREDLSTIAACRQSEGPKLLHGIRGDLDLIVMKCLEKERARRYQSASALAEDVRRHLDREPVEARPPSRTYRFQRLVQRNKLGFVAAAAIVAALVLGLVVSTVQVMRANRAESEQRSLREQAEANEQKAGVEAAKSQEVASFLQEMLKSVGPTVALGRDTTMLREILDKTDQRLTALKGQPAVEAELRNTIGVVYWELGEFDKSAAMHREALAIQRTLLGNEHPAVATSLHHLAEALRQEIKLEEAETAFRESLAIRRKLLGDEHADVARSLNHLASLLSIRLRDREPEMLLREALAIRRKLHGSEHRDVATTLDNLAHVLNRQGEPAVAIPMHEEALAIRKRVLGKNHPELVHSFRNLATAMQSLGLAAEAETFFRDALTMCETLFGPQHVDTSSVRSQLELLLRAQGKMSEAEALERRPDAALERLATSLVEAGKHLQDQGKLAEAEANLREALAIYTQLADEMPFYSQEATFTRRRLVEVLITQCKLNQAEIMCRDDLAAHKKHFGNVHREVGRALASLGKVLHQQRRLVEAEAVWREELEIEKTLSGNEHPFVANSLQSLATVLRDVGKLEEAEMVFRETLAMRRKLLASEDPAVTNSLLWLAAVLEDQGKLAEAESLHREHLAMQRSRSGEDHPDVASALATLTLTLLGEEKFTEAEPFARECLDIRAKKLADDWNTDNARSLLGASLLGQKKYAEAEPLLLSGYEGLKQREESIPAVSKLRLSEALQRVARFYEATADSAKAAEWRKKVAQLEAAAHGEPGSGSPP